MKVGSINKLVVQCVRRNNGMIINLTRSVPLKELCRITVIGNTKDRAKCVEFTLSHEAMIGFATELLWLYENINDTRKLIITTFQLEVDPAPNQAIGFYLTPNSPMMVLQVNSLTGKVENENEGENWKEIDIKAKNTNQYYYVKDPSEEECTFITLESYELSRKNIMNISVLGDKGNDITKSYHTMIFEINREGIKDFATMLFVWANNYKEGVEYTLPHIDKADYGNNLGIILAHDNIDVKFKCCDLGTVYEYDTRF